MHRLQEALEELSSAGPNKATEVAKRRRMEAELEAEKGMRKLAQVRAGEGVSPYRHLQKLVCTF